MNFFRRRKQAREQLAKQEAIAAAIRTHTTVLSAKNFAPEINVKTSVTSNVTDPEFQSNAG